MSGEQQRPHQDSRAEPPARAEPPGRADGEYRSFFENAVEGIYRSSPEGRFLVANPALARMLGYETPEQLMASVTDITHQLYVDPADRAELLRRLGMRGVVTGYECRCRRRDGTVIWVRVNVRAVRGEDGSLRYLEGMVEDVTARKQAEEALLARERMLARHQRALLHLAGLQRQQPAALDAKLRGITEVAARTLGVDRAGVWLYSADRSRLVCRDQYELSSGEHRSGMELPVAACPGYFQALGVRRAIAAHDALADPATRQLAEAYLAPADVKSVLDAPIRSEGRVIGVLRQEHAGPRRRWTAEEESFAASVADAVALAVDEWRRDRAQSSLRMKTDQLQAINEAMSVFLTSRDLRRPAAILLESALELTASECGVAGLLRDRSTASVLAHRGMGWAGEVTLELPAADRDAPEGAGPVALAELLGAVVRTRGSLVRGGQPIDASVGADAARSPLSSLLAVPVVSGAEVIGFVAVGDRSGGYGPAEVATLEDVVSTASVLFDSFLGRQREDALAEQLRQAQKLEALGQLAGGIAHDFNNLLMGIAGYARLARDRIEAPDVRADVVEIAELARRGAELTGQLLAFARRQPMETVVVDLNRLVRETSKMLERVIGSRVRVRTVTASRRCTARVDPARIEQVIVNLATNARDAMPEGGELTVRTERVRLPAGPGSQQIGLPPGTYVRLSVADTGVGMDEETRQRIFEPFFTTKERGKGTGLGLATAYGIVKQHGGHICAESEPGKGSCFRIYLPYVAAAAEEDAPRREEPSVVGGSETILVVEDAEQVLAVVERGLRSYGYRVLTARRASEAERLFDEAGGEVDLLLIDVGLPECHGPRLFERLSSRNPAVRVLYMSGYVEDRALRRAISQQRVPLIEKPFDAAALARAVRSALDRPATPLR